MAGPATMASEAARQILAADGPPPISRAIQTHCPDTRLTFTTSAYQTVPNASSVHR